MRSETVTALIILSAVVLIFVIIGWILVRADAKSRQRDAKTVYEASCGGGATGVVGALSVSCGNGGAGCGAVG